uniref:Uncharacterized protein n=1 Tax=Tetranychus urticae TaxID=32264 RepID=T1KS19_TETUR
MYLSLNIHLIWKKKMENIQFQTTGKQVNHHPFIT